VFEKEWTTEISPMVESVLRFDYSIIQNKREHYYRKIESWVNTDQSITDIMFERLETVIQSHVESMMETKKFPGEILHAFLHFSQSLEILIKIFNSVDRFILWKSGLCFDISVMAFNVWKSVLLSDSGRLCSAVVAEILLLVSQYRKDFSLASTSSDEKMEEDATSPQLMTIANYVNIIIKTRIYDEYFLKNFRDETIRFYSDWAATAVSNLSLGDYVILAKKIFKSEQLMHEIIRVPSSTLRVFDLEILRPQIVLNSLPLLIQRDMVSVLQSSSGGEDALSTTFELCNMVQEKLLTESVLKFSFSEGVKTVAKESLDRAPSERDIIPTLIELKNGFSKILDKCFGGKHSFVVACKDAFEVVVNDQSACAMLLADYCDNQLWENQSQPQHAPSLWLDDAMSIFKLVVGKDLFEVHYRNFLSKRLIHSWSTGTPLSAMADSESPIIAMLKAECGQGYTNKLEGMIRDILASEDISGAPTSSGGLKWKCSILTTGVWPSTICPWDGVLPGDMRIAESEKNFFINYKKNFEKKSVKFVYSLTTCVVRVYRSVEVFCSAAQAIILLLFNETDSMSMDVLLQETRIPEAETRRAIDGLVHVGVLSFGDGGFVSVGHQPIPNPAGSVLVANEYQFRRVPEMNRNHGTSHASVSEAERMQTEASVMEDRQHQLDALIVRTMKRLRHASARTLVREIQDVIAYFSQLEIVKRIESLVDREFLEKDGDEAVALSNAPSLDDVQIKYLI